MHTTNIDIFYLLKITKSQWKIGSSLFIHQIDSRTLYIVYIDSYILNSYTVHIILIITYSSLNVFLHSK